ncbi:STE/STE11/CDC15 protein kinase [Spizellomyces punctatus DAOM BR117]|uniref:STE/STE11/CDC15 protein kinase n=1 Tax=Spizellomyces punctatus (strain DAOM BR117) TaxID=645134 RepID=A0A0L0HPM9_SPIPD|nr:STE/STE11/CDC15 protein kinase [Spizellomyces punctatus DAOM BR117]KND02754.1 STE/STE11/CDC15 protein kinase [Spizellomyces punctatus DAOM BR117]|eukprot:XP_016610793.1 STE/STE11/CDC15 protein kinase [Spizellomyces punctatus DAOM BR117]
MTIILADAIQLGDCLGKGAFGCVYSGLVTETGEVVAVKQLRLSNIAKPDLTLITGEIDLLKELNHANIVQYLGFVKTPEYLNIIMEYCENGSLSNICRRFGRFPEHLVALYIAQVLEGLVYLHEQGVIHRDIKAANILTTKKGQVKLADFGIASKINATNKVFAGSPYWMAPEVIELHGATTASDIWSVGCTAIELLQGHPPYHTLAPMSALFRIVHDDHPSLPAQTSVMLRDFLMECFQKDANLRISAKRLLKHPWIESARRRVVARDLQQYILEDMNDGQIARAASSLPRSPSSQSKGSREKRATTDRSSPLRPASTTKFTASSNPPKADVEELCEPDMSSDVWDNDFEPFDVNLQAKSKDQQGPDASDHKAPCWLALPAASKPSEEDSDTEDDPFLSVLENMAFEETVAKDYTLPMTSGVVEFIERLRKEDDPNVLCRSCDAALALLDTHPQASKMLITHHAIGPILDALKFQRDEQLQWTMLRLINKSAQRDMLIQENICLLGGLNTLIDLTNSEYRLNVREEAALFLKRVCTTSSNSLRMFMACGGVRALVNLLEVDYRTSKVLIFSGIDGISGVLELQSSTPRTDICHLFVKHGLLRSLSRVFGELNEDTDPEAYRYTDQIANMLVMFSQGDVSLKESLAKDACIRGIVNTVPQLAAPILVKVLKCVKNVTMHSETLRSLEKADVIRPLCQILTLRDGPFFTDIQNQALNALYNLCRLNKSRQLAAALEGAVPCLQGFVETRSPLKQFAIPILTDMVNAGATCRKILWQNGALLSFISLLVDPCWQVDALEAISTWMSNDSDQIESQLCLSHHAEKLVLAFCQAEAATFESILTPFQRILVASSKICRSIARYSLFGQKICSHLSHPETMVRLNLLHILYHIVRSLSDAEMTQFISIHDVMAKLKGMCSGDGAVLVREQAKKCIGAIGDVRRYL